jgi:photosystem II stability/assembly factor-like uncharacterized protein
MTAARRRFLLLAGIVLIDVTLVALALRPHSADDTADTVSAASAEPSPSASADPVAGASPPTPERALLADMADASAMRVLADGACDAGGVVAEFSTDGGGRWAPVDLPVQTVLRVRITGPESAAVVGAGEDCRPAVYQTENAGETWSSAGSVAGTWHRYGPAETRVHAPEGNVESPCADGGRLTDLAPSSLSTATVLCSDGGIHRTGDGGAEWDRRGELAGAVALNQSAEGTLVAAVTGRAGCAGIGVQTSSDGGRRWETAACVADARARDGVALTFSDADTGLLVAGAATFRTTDGGATWVA